MPDFHPYFSDARQLFKRMLKGEGPGRAQGSFLLSRTDAGICSAYRVLGLPVFTTVYDPSFRKKIYVFGQRVLSCRREPLGAPEARRYASEPGRAPRVYVHVSFLPYFDHGNGIPRVAKKLVEEGLKRTDAEVLPVYPDPRDGTYRIALAWLRKSGYAEPASAALRAHASQDDPAITVRPGDWLVHTMLNVYELEFEQEHLRALRAAGVKMGFILHDIIFERHPGYFKRRDQRRFARWLRLADDSDGLFCVSRATRDDYAAWREEQGLPALPFELKWFHLGADFKKASGGLNPDEQRRLGQVAGKPYYIQVSTIEPRKGYRQLLDAFDLLWSEGSELCLVIVGRRGWLVSDLCRRIKRHPQLGRKLFWLSGVSDGLLAALYENARGVIFASESEGFGLSAAEGAFYRKPLLLRDIPVFREVAGDQASYFSGLDGAPLAAAVRKLDAAVTAGEARIPDIRVGSWADCCDAFLKLLR
ncbi:MAG: glycosyltransferase family 4 protein [Duodenibacillus sp.]|nr:glycosyltransferase family 4 protein [Duodenibacillus sp.]